MILYMYTTKLIKGPYQRRWSNGVFIFIFSCYYKSFFHYFAWFTKLIKHPLEHPSLFFLSSSLSIIHVVAVNAWKGLLKKIWNTIRWFHMCLHDIKTYMSLAWLGGPYKENLWPRSWKCHSRPLAEGSIFKPEVTVFHIESDSAPSTNEL